MFARRPSKRNDPEAATGATATARGLPVLQAQSGSVSIMNEVLSFFHGTEKQVHGGGLLDGASTNTPQGAATIPESI